MSEPSSNTSMTADQREGFDSPRKRAKLACQACQRRRTKCGGGQPRCENCAEYGRECIYAPSGLKRGPPKGFKPREHLVQANGRDRKQSPAQGLNQANGNGSSELSHRLLSKQGSAMMVNEDTRDYLLSIFFTHVHNVWPILYKPLFHPTQTHPVLLSAMLATASVVAVQSSAAPAIDAEALFLQAKDLLQRHRDESRMYVVQALFLLALAQTGRGNKGSAYIYAGQACAMALEMGLHRCSTGLKKLSHAEEESRSRVFWCCYVIDKAYAEETGKPAILASRRSTMPLPSISEADEFEFWPPPSAYTARHTNPGAQPVQSRIISAFNSTCQLGLIVEKILDLEAEGPRLGPHVTVVMSESDGETGSEEDIAKRNAENALRQRHPLARELGGWYNALPDQLRIDVDCNKLPLTHLVVNLAWYHSATILLHSRYIGTKSDSSGQTGLYGESHLICTAAAENIVSLFACLDRFKLLSQVRHDIIHMLSLAGLFHAYNSSLPDVGLANSAKLNFSQCCLWLRDISHSWAPASAHRLFFEGLIQGGLEMSADRAMMPLIQRHESPHEKSPSPAPDGPAIQMNGSAGRVYQLASQSKTVLPAASSMRWSSSIGSNLAPPAMSSERQPPWPNDLLQLPTLFWNDALGNATPDDPFSFVNDEATTLASPGGAFPRSSNDMFPTNNLSRETTQATAAEAEAYNSMIAYMLEAVGKPSRAPYV